MKTLWLGVTTTLGRLRTTDLGNNSNIKSGHIRYRHDCFLNDFSPYLAESKGMETATTESTLCSEPPLPKVFLSD